jgi:hypothetical protein
VAVFPEASFLRLVKAGQGELPPRQPRLCPHSAAHALYYAMCVVSPQRTYVACFTRCAEPGLLYHRWLCTPAPVACRLRRLSPAGCTPGAPFCKAISPALRRCHRHPDWHVSAIYGR